MQIEGVNVKKVMISPGRYVQGAGAIQDLGGYVKGLGANPLVIGGRHGLGGVRSEIEAGFTAAGLTACFEGFGGECCRAEIDRIGAIVRAKGIIDGLGVGLIIRAGGSLDGTEIVAIIMDRRSVFSVGEVVMFINLFILSSAGLLYGWDKAMYSLVAYFVISKMIDVVIKGLDESYAVMIVTNEHDEITSALNDRLGRGVTLLHGQGGYTGEAKEVLYCVVTRLEVDKLKEIVLEKDENAFVTINAVHDIVGGRFKKKAIH